MTPASKGTHILVKACSNGHGYTIGRVYRVHKVDNDGSFVAVDNQGNQGDWLKWIDCEPVGTGWEWLRSQLDARSLDILSAFDGIESLRLRESVETEVIRSLPNLDAAILNVLASMDAATESARDSESEADDEDQFDLSLIP